MAEAEAAFEQDKREILARLTMAKGSALQYKATINWDAFIEDVEDYLDGPSQEAWRKRFTPLMRGVVTEQGKRWAAALGLTFDVQNLFARDWFNRYMLKFAQEIGKTTKEYIGNVLNLGVREGWSIPQMQNRLTEVFKYMTSMDPQNLPWYADRLPSHRTEMIARTETIRASNAGSTELFKTWGVRQHEWLSTKDDRVRTYDSTNGMYDHLEADGQVVDMDKPFIVSGEELMFPGDPSGSPGNTINCRCTTIPVVEGME